MAQDVAIYLQDAHDIREAMEHAQWPIRGERQRKTGVFCGVTTNDYGRLLGEAGLAEIDAYQLTGNTLSTLAGRLSYSFDFHGPAMAVDTSCSSSL